MFKKGKFNFLLLFILVVSCFSTAFININNKVTSPSVVIAKIQQTKKEPNIQRYDTPEGEHTIYWAQGIQAPLMTSDESLLGTENYFEKNISGTYVNYDYPLEDNKGYYDLNKNKTSMHCYLGAAANVIHWWLDQNSSYISQYLTHLKNDDKVYSQRNGLQQLLPYDNSLWDAILTKPILQDLESSASLLGHALYKDPLVDKALKVYLNRVHDGYFEDIVIDFFFNGYQPIRGEFPEQNNFYEFDNKTNTGGLFYPIFGKERLTTRYNTSNYSFYNEKLKNFITNGYGVTISYFAVSNPHAITVWGAEYDANGNLCKIYITDTDDYDDKAKDKNVVYGLRGFDVKNDNGAMYLNNNTDPNAKPGAYMNSLVTLDLAQDKFQKRLQDISALQQPVITLEPQDENIAPGSSPSNLTVNASITDSGYLTYQWYKSDSDGGAGHKIDGANKEILIPDMPLPQPQYYYCEVTNNKNGKTTTTKTRYAKIMVKDDLVDALPPFIQYFNTSIIRPKQYERVNPLTVSAFSQDGGEISYQWYEKWGMVDSTAGGGNPIKGETRNFFIPTTYRLERASYYCVVTNYNKNATGKQKISITTKNAKVVDVYTPTELLNASEPVIGLQPEDVVCNNNDSITLSIYAKACDGGTVSYQWYKATNDIEEGVKLTNETSDTLNLQINNSGNYYYYCRIKNLNSNAKEQKETFIESRRALISVSGALSGENDLLTLDFLNAQISPEFSPEITSYDIVVPYDITKIIMSATSVESAVVTINNPTLNVGKNTIQVNVQAENGDVKSYIINATREPYKKSDNFYLFSLTMNGEMVANFARDVLVYGLEVQNNISTALIDAVAENEKATIAGKGSYDLVAGQKKVINIVCTAENGSSQTYTLNITRRDNPPPQPSSNNNLSNIEVLGYELSPHFNQGVVEYGVNVPYNIDRVNVSATSVDEKALVSGTGEFSLIEGQYNPVVIVCTSESGVGKTYTVYVYREKRPEHILSGNNNLSVLEVGRIEFNFDKSITEYNFTVKNSVSNVFIYAEAEHRKAIVDGTGMHDLSVGSNQIKVTCIAENNTQKVYTINITREEKTETPPVNPNLPDEPTTPENNDKGSVIPSQVWIWLAISLGIIGIAIIVVVFVKKDK